MKMVTQTVVCARNSPVGIEAQAPATVMLFKELSASEFLPLINFFFPKKL